MSDARPSEPEAGVMTPGSAILGRREGLDRECRVKDYDFRRPDKFSREQIKTVQVMHESFARLATTTLSGQLGQGWEVRLESVDQMTFEEFFGSVESPSLVSVAQASPLPGPLALQVDGPVYAAWLDRLLGGRGEGLAPSRPASGAEREALGHPLEWLLGCIRKSWAELVDLEPKLGAIETNPLYCQIVPPTEMIVLVTFAASSGGAAGRMNLVIPYLTIEPVVPRLSARYWYSKALAAGSERVSREVAYRVPVEAEVIVGGEALPLSAIAALGPGSLVRLDGGRARLRLGGREVLELKPRSGGRGRELSFDALRDAASPSPAPRAAEGGAESSLGPSIAAIERELASLGRALQGGLDALGARILALEGRHEALADRLAYGQSDASSSPQEGKPFARAASAPASAFAAALGGEGPQLVALVLSRLDDAPAAQAFEALPEAIRAEVARRVGDMGAVLPEVLASVDRWLSRELESRRADRSPSGGVEKVVAMLNLSARATERSVVEALARSAPAMAEEVKRRMFVFEDIVLLDDESFRALAERADRRDLLAAMKPVQEKVRDRIFERFGAEEGARLRAEYEGLGRVRLSESDAAGMRVVAAARELEREGRVFMAGGEGA